MTFVDTDRPETWAGALRPTTRVFYCETITNPLCRVTDLPAVVAFAREHTLTTVVDATFSTPVALRPLALGVDVEVHSATKYMAGHSDVIAGAIVADAAHVARFTHRLNHLGGALDPHAAFLLERGLKTLPLRVRQQAHNAHALATFFAAHEAVRRVHYPGFDPAHLVPASMRDLLAHAGGVLSIELRDADAAERFVSTTRLMTHAPSLGGTETLVTRPATTSHVGMSPEERAEIGVTDGVVRIACGIEATRDLIADAERALES